MTEEFRIFGPPGTGKTSSLAEWAARGAMAFGESQVSVCSLTRAAVREAAGRDLGLRDESVTTLHARCKRALGAGDPAEEHIEEFLREKPYWIGQTPRKILRIDEDESAPESRLAGRGDLAFNRMVRYRQELLPLEKWDRDAQELYADWSAWCKHNGIMDYTGWLEACQDGGVLPPQQVVLVDEAQDHTPLQMKVLRSWQTRRLAFFGDDDQSLYEWSGAKPEEFFLPYLPEGRERTLTESFRVPEAVHALAVEVTRRIRLRREKVYRPRAEPGEVIVREAPWAGAPPSRGMTESERERFARGHADAVTETILSEIPSTGTAMILATCGYHLEPILEDLRAWRVSYHNPWRKANTTWNPLREPTEALVAYSRGAKGLRREDVALWAFKVSQGAFFKAPKSRLEAVLRGSGELLPSEIHEIFSDEGLARARRGDLHEFLSVLPAIRSYRWDEAMTVLRREGGTPRVIVGTIHSVKGAEADTVIVLPNLSPAGAEDWAIRADRIFRLIYVAVTRARKRLVLIKDPSAGIQINWEELL